jgi:hypothetical protein
MDKTIFNNTIDHFASTNTGFMVKASEQLDLVVPKNLLWG